MSDSHGRKIFPWNRRERERLREKGQFWTPEWVARAMVEYLFLGECSEIYDPAVGTGVFLRVAKSIARERGVAITLAGAEVDPLVLAQARDLGLTEQDLARVELRDFLMDPPQKPLQAIVANPPYIRHHRIRPEVKAALQALAARILGSRLDGRAGLHVYFLLRALDLLAEGGRLAFILPADTFEGVFAQTLWGLITRRFRLDAVVTFAPEASPFPNVDINPVVVFLRRVPPIGRLYWARCHRPGTPDLAEWVRSGFRVISPSSTLEVVEQEVDEALHNGLSRRPGPSASMPITLGHYAFVRRGIATGANEFFFLTTQQIRELKLPEEFLVRAIGRTRDVKGDEITLDDLERLDRAGRPTWLLVPDGRPLEEFPEPLQRYLKTLENLGIPQRPILRTRNPWYKMERRPVPPFLFAYLGRRNARFVLNRAGVVPLTSFLCVYCWDGRPEIIARLWSVLRHPETLANLAKVGKSYGDGAIKVEPRALERLPLPPHVVAAAQLPLGDHPLHCRIASTGSCNDQARQFAFPSWTLW